MNIVGIGKIGPLLSVTSWDVPSFSMFIGLFWACHASLLSFGSTEKVGSQKVYGRGLPRPQEASPTWASDSASCALFMVK